MANLTNEAKDDAHIVRLAVLPTGMPIGMVSQPPLLTYSTVC